MQRRDTGKHGEKPREKAARPGDGMHGGVCHGFPASGREPWGFACPNQTAIQQTALGPRPTPPVEHSFPRLRPHVWVGLRNALRWARPCPFRESAARSPRLPTHLEAKFREFPGIETRSMWRPLRKASRLWLPDLVMEIPGGGPAIPENDLALLRANGPESYQPMATP